MARDEDLAARVARQLNTTGAPLEMRVARDMSAHGLHTFQGVYYEDPDFGESRKIDVIVTQRIQLGDAAHLAACFVIECKYSKDRPWVLFRDRFTHPDRTSNFERIATDYGKEWLKGARVHPAINDGHTFQQEPNAGYAVTTATLPKRDAEQPTAGKDLAYPAVQSATKAARWWATDLDAQESNLPIFAVVFPVVVIHRRLFEAYLDGEKIAVSKIDKGQVYWSSPAGQRPVLVDVLTEGAMREYARTFRETAEALVTHGKDAAGRINTSGVW